MRRASDNLYTVIFVPHTESPVASFRVRVLHLQVIILVLVVFFVGLIALVNQNAQLAGQLRELDELRFVNQEQRVLIRALSEEASFLQEQMVLLQELERQLLEMTKLSPEEIRRAGPQSFVPGDTGGIATVATAHPIAAPAEPPAGADKVVSLVPVAQAMETVARLADIKEEILLRQGTLEILRKSIAASQAEVAARPSCWPVEGYITSRFGYRTSPLGLGTEFHAGLDISSRRGTPIVATADAVVVFSGWMGRYGNTVILDHGYGYRTLYGHNDKNAAGVGERVTRGQIIAYMGSTGRSTGPHVHYEVHVNGKQVNPTPFLRGQ
ncbi:MAG: M23 family metallopeptidase [bacterium]|nr:M23 family metallopeptidase [bacterium]